MQMLSGVCPGVSSTRIEALPNLWGAVSRAVRTPTRFDQDIQLPFNGVVVVRGDSEFGSENVIVYEAGYRAHSNSHEHPIQTRSETSL